MKVGILTFHNTLNFGAALQSYALQDALERMGVRSEIIDYCNERRKKRYSVPSLLLASFKKGDIVGVARILIGAGLIHVRRGQFEKFYKQRMKISAGSYSRPAQLKEEVLAYDYYLVGSDQVWNYKNNGNDSSYLLDFVEHARHKVSYASSFGLDSIPEEMKDCYSRLLKGIHAISVREERGAQIVESLIGRTPRVVLDPVFLLEEQSWAALAAGKTGCAGPHVLLYVSHEEYYNAFVRVTGYDPKNRLMVKLTPRPRLGDFFRKRVKLPLTSGPEKFLGLMRMADMVLTTSFHGVAFAIIFKKKFVAFLSGDVGRDSRIVGLLDKLGLKRRIFHEQMTLADVEEPIGYAAVNDELRSLRLDSFDFLKKALSIQGGTAEKIQMLAPREQCTGCMACFNACPHRAIEFRFDEEGFERPHVREDRCQNCGLCGRACPVLHPFPKENSARMKLLAGVNTDEQILLQSSSGGLFTALAQRILREGGVVFGAAVVGPAAVAHQSVKKEEKLHKLRQSKYVQGRIGRSLIEVQQALEEGRKVLFSGLPCQIAGLYSFLGKDHELLYTMDVLCKGGASPGVFAAFIRSMEHRFSCEVLSFTFRDKRFGWENTTSVLALQDGRQIRLPLTQTTFGSGFSTGLFFRPSCYSCRYRIHHRFGDITLGDFWSIPAHSQFFKQRAKGVSLIMLNSPKGKELFASAANSSVAYEHYDDVTLLAGNRAMDGKSRRKWNRALFFAVFKFHPRVALKVFTWSHRALVWVRNHVRACP